MPPTRLQRNGATLDEVRDAVRTEFGAGARIVAAERVTTPGIGGLFRKAHVEATVEVPEPGETPTARVVIADSPVQRIGIAALLADADAAEARIARGDGTQATRADAFASVLDGFVADGITGSAPRPTRALPESDGPADVDPRLQAVTDTLPGGPTTVPDIAPGRRAARSTAPAVRSAVPAVRSADGDLVLLVGRANDVDAAAGLFAVRHALRPTDAADRRSAILARADGVRDGHAVLAVAAWDDRATGEGIEADQVWIVVDVGRKPEDTAAMVSAVAARLPVAGVVAIGAAETATPESVDLLGVPVLSLG
ncbi:MULTISPECIES: hypothetical protein [unclassified Curtobacterium]|uniref:hypothetical protein n=1 Tax=unclassified Curtobacterium TaxID=257496 RepID=UPI000F46B753|nr:MULTISPECIES: hypothetical protein [unclassified Curtobacterium]ROQ07734.1 hypothetical protein EDF41_2025 [Curtobacterium sp. PhB171]ROQ23655.1 hypothetical protein EDF40_2224 [Curtobacterium sp. PhB170]ROS35569.1 hypothetical protein EDF25_1401 [Curtobacterium sp. PhB131]ROS69678.1 hypothetical protein EDF30_1587 [Curtobacterium sp. PhB141]